MHHDRHGELHSIKAMAGVGDYSLAALTCSPMVHPCTDAPHIGIRSIRRSSVFSVANEQTIFCGRDIVTPTPSIEV